jgi:ribosomal protein S18 acetylase RimI-like enzyme
MRIRPADVGEIEHLARLWHAVWHESHAPIQPAALARRRTVGNFRDRLQLSLPDIRVAEVDGTAVGFCVIKDDELYQLFVAAEARGTGAAAALIADAEARLAARGVEVAWLSCAIDNHRAARFYEKSGWHLVGTVVENLDTADGPFPLEIWRFEKRLTPTT